MSTLIERITQLWSYMRAEGPLNPEEVCRVTETTLADLIAEFEGSDQLESSQQVDQEEFNDNPMIIIEYSVGLATGGTWTVEFVGDVAGYSDRDGVVTQDLSLALDAVISGAEFLTAVLDPDRVLSSPLAVISHEELQKYMIGFVSSSVDAVQAYVDDVVATESVQQAPFEVPRGDSASVSPILITTPEFLEDRIGSPVLARELEEVKRAKLRKRPRRPRFR